MAQVITQTLGDVWVKSNKINKGILVPEQKRIKIWNKMADVKAITEELVKSLLLKE